MKNQKRLSDDFAAVAASSAAKGEEDGEEDSLEKLKNNQEGTGAKSVAYRKATG